MTKIKENASNSKNPKNQRKKSPDIPNYEAIARSPEFKSLKKKRNKFIVLVSIFFLLCYITLPILTSYTTVLNTNAFGDIAWVWVYAIALFIMTWTLCMIYVSKASGYDKEAEHILEKEKAGDYK